MSFPSNNGGLKMGSFVVINNDKELTWKVADKNVFLIIDILNTLGEKQ